MANALASGSGVPEIWTGKLKVNVDKRRLVTQEGIINRDYEGEFSRKGDIVHILGMNVGTLGTYDRVNGYGDPDRLETTDATISITECDSYDMVLDQIELAQLEDKGVIQKYTSAKALQMATTEDNFVLAKMVAGVYHVSSSDTNRVTLTGSAGIASAAEFYDRVLVEGVVQKLDEHEIDPLNRFAIVDASGLAQLRLDTRFVGSGAASADNRLLNGEVGSAAGLRILVSSAAAVRGKVLAGVGTATTVADQVQDARIIESERFHGFRVQGLHTYGAGVVEPKGLAVCTWTKKTV